MQDSCRQRRACSGVSAQSSPRVTDFDVLHMSDEVAEGLRMRLPLTELRRRLPSFIDLQRALETSKAQCEAAPDATL